MKFSLIGGLLAAVVLAGAGHAATYNFSGPGENLGKDEVFLDTTATSSVTAIAINTEEPPKPQLHLNNNGLGVNSQGGIFQNQVENIGDDEAIVFDFGSSAIFESMSLTIAGAGDEYRIYGTNDASVAACSSGGLSCLTTGSTLLASGTGTGMFGGADVALSGTFRYLIATTPSGRGDRFRVDQVVASTIPLPAAGMLLMGALGGLVVARRRRR